MLICFSGLEFITVVWVKIFAGFKQHSSEGTLRVNKIWGTAEVLFFFPDWIYRSNCWWAFAHLIPTFLEHHTSVSCWDKLPSTPTAVHFDEEFSYSYDNWMSFLIIIPCHCFLFFRYLSAVLITNVVDIGVEQINWIAQLQHIDCHPLSEQFVNRICFLLAWLNHSQFLC